MRSRFADYFNHDEDARDYDLDVTREEDPLRTGYGSLLAWVGGRIPSAATVLDLGSGTGNTIRALPADCRVTAVDISVKMTEIAKEKLTGRRVAWIVGDILEFVEETPLGVFDSIVSTYALHHLTPEERERLFARVRETARSSTSIVIGDLMYRNSGDRERIVEKFRPTFPELSAAFEEEFFWDIEQDSAMLEHLGWKPRWREFSDLSWAVELL